MTLRKPLVIVSGQVQQLQAGDDLDATIAEQEVIQLTNNNASSITLGQVVYLAANSAVDLAIATASGTAYAIGMVKDATIATASPGSILTSGVIAATIGEWDALAGTTGGLVYGTTYYLSDAAAGSITAAAPTTVSEYVVKIGTAISTTELKLDIGDPVLL